MEQLLETRKIYTYNLIHMCNSGDALMEIAVKSVNPMYLVENCHQFTISMGRFFPFYKTTVFFLHRISSILLELAGFAVKIGFQSAR